MVFHLTHVRCPVLFDSLNTAESDPRAQNWEYPPSSTRFGSQRIDILKELFLSSFCSEPSYTEFI